MPPAKRQRKLVLFLCLSLAGIILAALSLPVWFPWVLRPIAARYGVQYGTYVRKSYWQLSLQQLTFTNQDLKIEVSDLDSTLPIIWLSSSRYAKDDDPVCASEGLAFRSSC
jgi:hypothetical protein